LFLDDETEMFSLNPTHNSPSLESTPQPTLSRINSSDILSTDSVSCF